jgi:hypothetical protein
MEYHSNDPSAGGSKNPMLHIPRTAWLVLTFVLLSGTYGCASGPEPLTFSGFLENYSHIRPASDESGAWVYRKPGLDFNPYTKIMLDPLVIWPSEHSSYKGMHTGKMWQLALAFQEEMSKALQSGYTIVQQPGPGVLRLRAALTEVNFVRPTDKASGPLLPLVGDIVMQTSKIITGSMVTTLSGNATIEAELLDSQTQERLVAYIEKRKSEKTLITKDPGSLGPIREIFDYWAKKLRRRLDQNRG